MSVPSTTNSDTPIDGISSLAIASPFSGRFFSTRTGGIAYAFSSVAWWRSARYADNGSCQSRVTPASLMSRTPLTIITDAVKRSTARMGRSLGAVGYGLPPLDLTRRPLSL